MNYSEIQTGENDLLVVVDMQEDFVRGALGTPEAQAMLADAAGFIRGFRGKKVFTMDTHGEDYLATQEGKNLPVPHTVKGSDGWQLAPEIKALVAEGDTVLEKGSFGSLVLAEVVRQRHYDNIYFLGVCTGICVISNAVIAKAADPEAVIHILAGLCACVSPESHRTALEAMRLLQMKIEE